MKKISFLLFVSMFVYALTTFAQPDDANSNAPPKPLDDNIHQWMIGEWTGTSESNMGSAKEWQKCEWACDKQYVLVQYTSQFTKLNPDFLKMNAEQMKMSVEEVEKMMMGSKYTGLGVLTMDPKSGEYLGQWYDNWRGSYKGRGKLDGKKVMMHWEGTMGPSDRTVGFEDENTMIWSFKENMSGSAVEGKSTFTRKKK
ncbi:MAG: hypothetical protein KGZ58_09480 [Ignavibacteriales bacterium]|nr:hypothetical protein [Ignavibacteriales bacterium]